MKYRQGEGRIRFIVGPGGVVLLTNHTYLVKLLKELGITGWERERRRGGFVLRREIVESDQADGK